MSSPFFKLDFLKIKLILNISALFILLKPLVQSKKVSPFPPFSAQG